MSATAYIDEAQAFLDHLDAEHPDEFLRDSSDFRRKLEMVLDRLHALVRDDQIKQAANGFRELTHLFTEFTTNVAVQMHQRRFS